MMQLIEFGKISHHYKFQNLLIVHHMEIKKTKINQLKFVFIEFDKQQIPFEIKSVQSTQATESVVEFLDVQDYKDAAILLRKKIFVEQYIAENICIKILPTIEGYLLIDQENNPIGKIITVNENGKQTLIEIEHQKKNKLIPLHEDWVLSLHKKNKTLQLNLPAGILDLD